MKYKICKLVDGNGKEWYQIEIKGRFFNYYHSDINYSNYDDCYWYREPNRYSTEHLAKEAIKALIIQENSQKIRLLECVEYGS